MSATFNTEPRRLLMGRKPYEVGKWSLDELFTAIDAPEVGLAVSKLEEEVQRFESRREECGPGIDPGTFLEILAAYEAIDRSIDRLEGFGSLLFAGDTQDQDIQVFMAKMQQLNADVNNRTLFFELWWKELDEAAAGKLLEVSGDYRYWLEALRLHRPYTLSEAEEKVINIKDVNGPQALVDLYTSITNRYVFHLEVEGEVKELTREELEGYRRSLDPNLREAGYQELFRVFAEDAPVLGQIYQYRLRDWRSELIGLRGYGEPIAPRNLANDIPDEVVDILLGACQNNKAIFHRFFHLKAGLMGMDRLRRYDIYASVAKADKEYPFGGAAGMVLDSFQDFDPRFAELSRRVFDEKHIDSEIRKGKRAGAFCATVNPDMTPWVLQNYIGTPRNVSTMAHELGHAIHSMLAEHHTSLTHHASLPLAETASTFAEMLFIDYLLEREGDPDVRRDVLFGQMGDAYATIARQAYFAMFERDAHRLVGEGATVDDLHKVYFDNLIDQFGESLDLSEDFRYEWLTIPHIYHVPFYVYAYAFGQLLVLSLYKQYQEDADAFKPRYIEILSAGGSASPKDILARAGIDIHDPSFWQGGFDVLDDRLKTLEALEV
jgi:oligoendopeptidase F